MTERCKPSLSAVRCLAKLAGVLLLLCQRLFLIRLHSKPGSGCLTDGFQWRFFYCKAGTVYESVVYMLRYDDEASQQRIVSVIASMLTGRPAEEWLQAPADATPQS